jgi:hypothetical protein
MLVHAPIALLPVEVFAAGKTDPGEEAPHENAGLWAQSEMKSTT